MEQLDRYMLSDVYSYLNICDKTKCYVEDFDLYWKFEMVMMGRPYGTFGCRKGVIEMVNYSIMIGQDSSKFFVDACAKRQIDVIKLLISYTDPIKGKIYNYGYGNLIEAFFDACVDGHIHIIELILLAESLIFDESCMPLSVAFTSGLDFACREGHKNVIEFLIDKGATDYDDHRYVDYADRRGIVEMMVMRKKLIGINAYEKEKICFTPKK